MEGQGQEDNGKETAPQITTATTDDKSKTVATPILKEETPKSTDRQSKREQKELSSEEKRGETLKRHIHVVVCFGIYFIAFVILSIIGIWAWHLAMPEKMKWLTIEQNQVLERIVFGSVLISVAGRYFKKYHILDGE